MSPHIYLFYFLFVLTICWRRGINRLWEETKNKTNRGGGVLTDCGNKQKIKQIEEEGY
jgi:hypothetical protein